MISILIEIQWETCKLFNKLHTMWPEPVFVDAVHSSNIGYRENYKLMNCSLNDG